jgi:hypothetical protein
MDSLFLLLNYNNTFKRQILFLKHLNSLDSFTTTGKLATHLGYSRQTLMVDIKQLNENLESILSIEVTALGEIRYQLEKNHTIDSVIAILYRQTLVYQLIDSILHNQNLTLEQASMKFYTSRSSLAKLLKHMNKVVRSYGLSIRQTPIQFVGDEETIRIFFFQFYSELGESTLIHVESDIISQKYVKLLHEIEPVQLYLCYYHLSFMMAIARVRRLHKQYVEMPDNLEEQHFQCEVFYRYKKYFSQFYKGYYGDLSSLTLAELKWSYICVLSCVTYSDKINSKIKNQKYVYHREDNVQVMEYVNLFLEQVFPKNIVREDCSLDRMKGFLINMRLLSKLSPSFEMVSAQLKDVVITMHKELYLCWYHRLSAQPKNSPLSFQNKEDVAVSLAILHSNFLKITGKRSIQILFAFHGEPGFDDYIAEASKMLLRENVKAEYFLEYPITNEVVREYRADLIICNYELRLLDPDICPIVRLSNIPTLDDWGIARDIIDRLLQPINHAPSL